MKHRDQIEASLDRSLRKQVKVPRLDSRFDAGVWSRIEAEASRSAAPALRSSASATPLAARWLYVINLLGLGSVAIFLCMFGVQMLAGMEVSGTLPEFSEAAIVRIVMNVSTVIAAVAVAFGVMFTPLGRRIRAEFG